MDDVNRQVAIEVLRLVGQARALFGGDAEPAESPAFAPDRGLEDGLGRGTFFAAR